VAVYVNVFFSRCFPECADSVVFFVAMLMIEHLQYVQGRLPLTLSSDTLMANCMWEFFVIWNRDPEVTYALDQAIVYLRCVENAALRHGTMFKRYYSQLVLDCRIKKCSSFGSVTSFCLLLSIFLCVIMTDVFAV